ncbi:VOC family protein [Nocardioides sp. MAHUQ-72]|uniref:VOC family protein n=1 Tax=unclassified Nocardioides TaxID=2615069 RepID=UPI00362270A0
MTTWQLTIDCTDPSVMVRFWGPALGYVVQPPPEGHATWNDWYRSVGVPEDELDPTGDGSDRICDPKGEGPTIWFQVVPERKTVKNRFHFDVYPSGRDRSIPLEQRRTAVEAAVAELIEAGASVLRRFPDDFDSTVTDHYFVTMLDPEGNEFCVS